MIGVTLSLPPSVARMTPAMWEWIATRTPLGRAGEADDLRAAIVFLASPGAKFVTGQTLSPNGGWHMSQ